HQPSAFGSSAHGPLPPLNIRRPMMCAPAASNVSPNDLDSSVSSPPSCPCRSRKLLRPYSHSCSSSPPCPSGSSSVAFGPATNPSSDIVISALTFVIEL